MVGAVGNTEALPKRFKFLCQLCNFANVSHYSIFTLLCTFKIYICLYTPALCAACLLLSTVNLIHSRPCFYIFMTFLSFDILICKYVSTISYKLFLIDFKFYLLTVYPSDKLSSFMKLSRREFLAQSKCCLYTNEKLFVP